MDIVNGGNEWMLILLLSRVDRFDIFVDNNIMGSLLIKNNTRIMWAQLKSWI